MFGKEEKKEERSGRIKVLGEVKREIIRRWRFWEIKVFGIWKVWRMLIYGRLVY